MTKSGTATVARKLGVALDMLRRGYRVDRRSAVLLTVLTVTGSVTAVGLGLSLQRMVARAGAHQVGATVAWAAVAALAFASTAIGRDVRHNMFLELSQRVGVMTDAEAFGTSAGLDTVEHLERPDYLDRMVLLREAGNWLSGSGWVLMEVAANVVGVALSVLLLSSVHPAAVLLAVLAVPSLLLTRRAEARVHRSRVDTAADVRAERHLHELCIRPESAKEIKISQAAGYLGRRADEHWQRISDVSVRVRVRAAIEGFAGWLTFAAGYLVVLAIVVYRAATGRGSVAEIVLMITLAGQIRGQVADVVHSIGWTMWSFHGIEQYLWLRDHADSRARQRTRPAPTALTRGISLRGVSFSYPQTDRPILRDVSLDLPVGSTVALVGLNGAGKTTLVKLLCGMYEPDSGTIEVDDCPLSTIDLVQWRAQVTAAYQDFARFQLSLGTNVGVGNLPLIGDQAAIRAALGRAGTLDAGGTLPTDLDTQLGTAFGGAELSLGQWQALAVARAFMRPAPLLLILDEPTASLDPRAEHLLYERYVEAGRGAGAAIGGITLLVSHRFSTVRMADLIVVLEDGAVAERGTHAELLRAGGRYAASYRAQADAYR